MNRMKVNAKAAVNIFEKQIYDLPIITRSLEHGATDNTHGKRMRTAPAAALGYLSPSSTGLVEGFSGLSIGGNNAESSNMDDQVQHDLYCTTCKKRFANAATYATHQQSEKHKKKQQQNKQGGARLSGSKIPKDALKSLEKARSIMHKDPAVAATVLWNIARDIVRCDKSVVESVLRDALDCMRRMEEDPKLRGSKESPTAWTARMILKTMLECRLALARLLYTDSQTRAESANHYTMAVCQYLGVREAVIASAYAEHTPLLSISNNAFAIVATIPRKFGKQEDVSQAIDAMEEAANALLALSADEDNPLAWYGITFYFLVHAFALSKGDSAAAYRVIDQLTLGFESLNMSYFGNECAMLVIEHHMQNEDAFVSVASAVAGSLLAKDLVRARRLLEALNDSPHSQPWSRYMAEFVAKMSMLDSTWMCEDAWAKWIEVSSALEESDPNIFAILNDVIDCLLSPYKWFYMP